MKHLIVEDVEREIHRMDPKLKGDEFKVAVLLMSALQVKGRPTVKALCDYTAYPNRLVRLVVARALANGIFYRDGRIAAKQWFEKDGALQFWCDVAVCIGWLERAAS